MNVFPHPSKHRARKLAHAFAIGAGVEPVMPGAPLASATGPDVVYGFNDYAMDVVKSAVANGRPYYFIDNGYFGRGDINVGFFRVTLDAWQHTGIGRGNPARFHRFGVDIVPWQTGGRHVLVCPPGAQYGRMLGFDAERWLLDTLATLERSTDRPVRVRAKPDWRSLRENHGALPRQPSTVPLFDDLRHCHAVVTHTSNVAVEAILHGVPAFVAEPCAAELMSSLNFEAIERPFYPDNRKRWAQCLAANQWTRQEMREGVCWEGLRDGMG